jgi:hypothetical protein
METLKTGDILLFSEQPSNVLLKILDCLVKKCTCSIYSHSAIVIVDPPFAPKCKGTFVWESSWHGTKDPQDNIVKFGVQLTPIEFYMENYPGNVSVYKREPLERNLFTNKKLIEIHKKVYMHEYDTRVKDWCSALFKKRIENQTDVFTCSAFVSYVLTELEILDKTTAWTVISAADLSGRSLSTLLKWNVLYSYDYKIKS